MDYDKMNKVSPEILKSAVLFIKARMLMNSLGNLQKYASLYLHNHYSAGILYSKV
jgi:hypothetical protein